jgi:hypothetical protein
MNKEVYREKIEQEIIGITLKEDSSIIFNKKDGTNIEIGYYHEQDCCENVYADITAINYYISDIINKKYEEIIIKSIPEMGFMICLYRDWDDSEKIFIPCYNSQNGYYSGNLKLIINKELEIDISDCVEDNIY